MTAQQAPRGLSRRVHRSPDRTLVAAVVSLKQRSHYGESPSRVEIRRADGRLLASRDHSGFPNQGYTVEKAAWTADSRYFVYLVMDSGGHSPWHHPLFFYSRKRQRFYSLDRALGTLGHGDGAITGSMELRSPCTVLTKGRYSGKSQAGLRTSIELGDASGEQLLAIDLRWLEPRLDRTVESSDKAK